MCTVFEVFGFKINYIIFLKIISFLLFSLKFVTFVVYFTHRWSDHSILSAPTDFSTESVSPHFGFPLPEMTAILGLHCLVPSWDSSHRKHGLSPGHSVAPLPFHHETESTNPAQNTIKVIQLSVTARDISCGSHQTKTLIKITYGNGATH